MSNEKFYPYGRTSSGGVGTDKQFTGHQKEGALYFMQARFYDPMLGRFMSADSIVPEPGNPQSLNRYSYVNNNPLRYTDPTGLSPNQGLYCVLSCGGQSSASSLGADYICGYQCRMGAAIRANPGLVCYTLPQYCMWALLGDPASPALTGGGCTPIDPVCPEHEAPKKEDCGLFSICTLKKVGGAIAEGTMTAVEHAAPIVYQCVVWGSAGLMVSGGNVVGGAIGCAAGAGSYVTGRYFRANPVSSCLNWGGAGYGATGGNPVATIGGCATGVASWIDNTYGPSSARSECLIWFAGGFLTTLVAPTTSNLTAVPTGVVGCTAGAIGS